MGANKRYLATHGKNFLLEKKYIDLGRVQISPDSTIGYKFTSLNLAMPSSMPTLGINLLALVENDAVL